MFPVQAEINSFTALSSISHHSNYLPRWFAGKAVWHIKVKARDKGSWRDGLRQAKRRYPWKIPHAMFRKAKEGVRLRAITKGLKRVADKGNWSIQKRVPSFGLWRQKNEAIPKKDPL